MICPSKKQEYVVLTFPKGRKLVVRVLTVLSALFLRLS